MNNDTLIKNFEREKGTLTIGFMGTLMRDSDFDCVVPALQRIIKEYGSRICVEFIGYCPKELKEYNHVKTFDFMDDYNEFRKFFASRKWDIGLGPLKDTEFNRSKTNNKYREYSSFHVAGIFSNMATYNYCVQDGINGLLVKNTEDAWYYAIKKLLDNTTLRETIAENAWGDIKKNYSIEKFAKALMNVFCRYHTGSKEIQDFIYPSLVGMRSALSGETSFPRAYDPEMLCFSKAIIKPRKYKVFCESPAVRMIGILFGQEVPSKGTVTIKVYTGRHLLRSITKTIKELDFSYWNYFDVVCRVYQRDDRRI